MFSILKNKRGESSMDTAIALIISVVIGGLVLAIIIGLTNDKVIPSFKESFKKQSTSVVYSEISSTSSETSYQKGDVNKDGTVDENDYKYLERYLNNWPEYDKIDTSTADINGDGTVDKNDLTELDSLINTVMISDIENFIVEDGSAGRGLGPLKDDILTVSELKSGKYKISFDRTDTCDEGNPVCQDLQYIYIFKDLKYVQGFDGEKDLDLSEPDIVVSKRMDLSRGKGNYSFTFDVPETISNAKIVIFKTALDYADFTFENYKIEKVKR